MVVLLNCLCFTWSLQRSLWWAYTWSDICVSSLTSLEEVSAPIYLTLWHIWPRTTATESHLRLHIVADNADIWSIFRTCLHTHIFTHSTLLAPCTDTPPSSNYNLRFNCTLTLHCNYQSSKPPIFQLHWFFIDDSKLCHNARILSNKKEVYLFQVSHRNHVALLNILPQVFGSSKNLVTVCSTQLVNHINISFNNLINNFTDHGLSWRIYMRILIQTTQTQLF